ncbi:MAG: sialidase family protein [Pseudonocardiaceae bacterium]
MATGQDIINDATAVDSRTGRIYVAWAADSGRSSPSGFGNLGTPYVAWSDDDGKTFTTPMRVGPDGDVGRRMVISVTGQGTVLAAWADNTVVTGLDSGAFTMRLARSTDQGKTWTTGSPLPDGGVQAVSWPNIYTASDGAVWLAWLDGRPVDKKNVAGGDVDTVNLAVSRDGGQTFTPSWVAKANACSCCRPSLAQGPNGQFALAYRNVSPQPGPEGQPMTPPPATPSPAASTAGDTGMGHMNMGSDSTSDTKLDDIRDIVIVTSSDGGHDWSQIHFPYHDNWHINSCPRLGPSVSYDHDGKRLAVTWDTGADGRVGVWTATSPDNGSTWSPAVRLSSQPSPPGGNPVSVPGKDGSRWIAWANPKDVQVAHISDSGAVATTAAMRGKNPVLAPGRDDGPPLLLYTSDKNLVVRRLGP